MSIRSVVTRTLGLFSLLISMAAWAQPYQYHVYIDSDQRSTTGCTVSGGGQSFEGADYRLTATVSGNPPLVTTRTLAACDGGSFAGGNVLPSNYPVGLNNGLPLGGAFADVIELSVARAQLAGAEPIVRIGFGAASASGSVDVLYTANGQVGGPPMVVGLAALIPTIGFFGALLLALALAALALRALKHNRRLAQMLLIGAFFSAGFAAWAANFIADGQVGDWSGSSPVGLDAIGDSLPNLSATDIVGAFAAEENRNLHFRIDVVDAENRPPVAVGDAYTMIEDGVLNIAAPGVLANDSDPDGNPITAQLVTGPTRGTLTLNADGSFVYTPNANVNGSDSFTYNAFDGQVTSLSPATVTIAITSVNDVPVFTAGSSQTVLEDAGAQTVNPWASGIDDGDPEVTQALSFEITANSNAALFSAGPAVSPSGVLSYTPAANANGSATITLRLNDDGGTANGGVNSSATQTFTISVTAVNDAPSFTVGPDQTVNEDAGSQVVNPWATAISAGPPDESGQAVSFEITNNSNAALFSALPAVSPTGVLSYTPAANANGVATITLRARDNGGTANGGVDASATQTFTITVNAINDAPSFTVGPNQTVLEDAGAQTVNPWATALDDGDPELTQALSFVITANSNAALFSSAPAVSPTGVLTYTPAANANGSATITLRIEDDGSSTPPNVNTSATQTFTITVTAVNDAPTLTAANPPTVLEDAGPLTVANWATFNPGPPDEAGQTVLGYQISAISNPALFAVPPAVANNGTLTYTPAANANGSSSFVARVQDSGGTANGGVDLSIAQTFTITVTPVNDAPSFIVGPNQTVDEDAGPQTVNPWATALNDGDPEITQNLSFVITANSNAALFSSAPAVSPTGVLTYTPAANANGIATITLRVQDDGSNTPPNVNTSATQTFTITVTPVNDAPSFLAGPNQTVDEDAGAQTVNPWATAISAGPADESGQTLGFNVTGNTNAALFSAQPAISPTGALTYTPAANANGVATITLTLSDNGGNTPPNVNTSAPQSFTITVNPVNDAPVNAVPGAQGTGDTVPLVFSTTNTNAINVADIDAAAGIVQMSFGTGAAANGTLTLANPGSVLTSLTGNGTQQVIATGTVTALNLALNGPSGSLTYTPVAGTTAARIITVITNDQGNTGSGGALLDTDTITVNVDAPPVVTSTPVNGATIANNAPITVNFSESVNVIAGITLTCGGPNLITGGATGAAVSALNLTYSAPLPAGSCTLTVPAASVSDADVIDPPNNPAANYVATFTVDAAPAVTTTTPINGATTANNVALSINFNEPIDATGAAVTLNCGGPIALGAITGTGVSVLNPTYTAPLPSGACTLTVVAAQIDDSDTFDPPANPAANTVINFTVDAPPALVSATPAAAAVVGTGQTVSFTYDEPVNDLGGAITLNCGANVPGTVGGSGTATLTFTPTNPLTAGASCTATAVALQIGDLDLFDPPQNPAANSTRSFTVDTPPSVTTTNPVSGAIDVPLAGVVVFNFTEDVDFVVADFTYVCNGNPVIFGVAGSGTNQATLTPTGNIPVNAPCTVTALTTIVDSDTADPPNNLSAAFPVSFTSVNDSAPTVAVVTPLNGEITRSGPSFNIAFSEQVSVGANAIVIACTPSGATITQPAAVVSNILGLAFAGSPATTGQPGDTCTITVESTLVTDIDAIDPPNELDGNNSGDTNDGDADDFVSTYTIDVAPVVTSTFPAGGTTANNVALQINFSEPVDATGAAVTLNCGGPIALGAITGTGVSVLNPTYTAPLPAGPCTLTVVAAQINDSDALDPPANPAANTVVNFTVDAAPSFVSSNPANGGVASTTQAISFTFSENVDDLGNAIQLQCGGAVPGVITGSGTPTLTFTPDAPLTPGASCIASVGASDVGDSDSFDPPQNLTSGALVNFTVDAAPDFSSSLPANNAVNVGLGANLSVTFTEPVNFTASAFTLDCPGGSPVAFTVSGSGSNTASIDPTPATLPINTLCVLTVDDAQVTDVDLADPPNAGSGVTTISFTTVNDNPPTVVTNPANGAANIALNGNITVTFNETVTLTGAWFQLNCPISGMRTSTGELTGTGINIIENTPDLVYTIDPIANLANGESCAITIDSASVVDNDAIDPPNELDGDASGDTADGDADDYVAQFTTPDVAPTVTSTPAAGATVPNTQAVTLNFSEQVNVAAGAINFNCGAAVTFTPALPQSGISTLTLTPTAALPNGANCTVTLESTLITDVDAIDPPNELDGDSSGDLVDGDADDFSVSFNVDSPPTPLSLSVDVAGVPQFLPLLGGQVVDVGSNIRAVFSENIDATAAGITLECPVGVPVAFAGLPVANNTNITVNPTGNLPGDTVCRLTLVHTAITDSDSFDPPNQLDGDGNGVEGDSIAVNFTTQSIALDDAYTVTPHLTFASPTSVRANDNPVTVTVTGFGNSLGTANGTVPNGTNFITAGGAGGRVVMNADGTFSFFPDATDDNTDGTVTFFYTISGGDTAQVTLTFEAEQLVWFADSTPSGIVCTGTNVGTQACPSSDLSTIAGNLTVNDILFIDSGNYGCGLTLPNNVLVVGNGATSTLAALAASRVTPVPGSDFAPYNALNGVPPVLSVNGTCIQLGQDNALQGFTINDSGLAGNDIAGNAFGTLTVDRVTLGGNGRALNLVGGTLNGNFLDIDVNGSNNEGLRLASVGGTWSVTSSVSISNISATGFNIANTPAGGSATFTNGVAVNKSSSGTALLLTGNAAPIDLGPVAITAGAGTAAQLSGSGLITISGGSLTATGGPALDVATANLAVTLASASSTNSSTQGISIGSLTGSIVIGNGGSIVNPTGTAFNVANGLGGGVSYGGAISKTSSGTLVFTSGAGGGDLTLSGNLSCTAACGTGAGANGVRVGNRTGGTLTFSGASKVFNSSTANTGISLDSNTGATISFTGGGLGVVTTSGDAFAVTGGGTVNVTGAGNSLSATTGTGLLVNHPASQPVNLNFASIVSSGGTSTHGIRLNNISGTVTVTGVTTIGAKTTAGIEISNSSAVIGLSIPSTVTITNRPNNGIRIANSSGTIGFGNTTINSSGVGTPAIRIDASSSAVTFAQTNINMNGAGGNENFEVSPGNHDAYTPRDNAGNGDAIYVTGLTGSLTINGGGITQPGDDGIDIRNSRNLTLSAMTFTEPGRSATAGCVDCNSSGVQAFGLTGLNSVSNSSFVRGRLRNFYISNPTGTTTLNITGSTFDDTRGQGTPATDNLQIYASGTASAAFNISNSTFLKSATHQINAVAKDNAVITELDITGITMNNDGGPSSGIRVDAEGASQIALNVIGNPVLYSQDENVVTVSTTGTAQLQGRIADNPDMRFTTASPGGSSFVGMRAVSDGTTSRVTLAITNNVLNVNNGTDGITLSVQGASAARIDANITGNTLTAAGAPGIPLDGINAFVNPTLGGSKVVCMTAAGNTVNGIWNRAARARAFSPTGTYVTGYSGSFAATWIAQGNNSGAIVATEFAGGGGVVAAPPQPCATPVNPLP